jgi:hypothetical protein
LAQQADRKHRQQVLLLTLRDVIAASHLCEPVSRNLFELYVFILTGATRAAMATIWLGHETEANTLLRALATAADSTVPPNFIYEVYPGDTARTAAVLGALARYTEIQSPGRDAQMTPDARRVGTAGIAARAAKQSRWAFALIVVAITVGAALEIAKEASAPLWIVIGLILIGSLVAVAVEVRKSRAEAAESSRAVGKLAIDAVDVSYPLLDDVSNRYSLVRLDLKVTNVGSATVLANHGRLTALAIDTAPDSRDPVTSATRLHCLLMLPVRRPRTGAV